MRRNACEKLFLISERKRTDAGQKINGGRRDRQNRGYYSATIQQTHGRTTRLTGWAGGREGCRTRIADLPLAQNGVCLCGGRRGISYNRRLTGPC